MSMLEHEENDAEFIVPLPPDITVMSEDSCEVDSDHSLPPPHDMTVVSSEESGEPAIDIALSEESSAERVRFLPALSALEMEFAAEGPPSTEVATIIPDTCFFPANIYKASDPYTLVEETEFKRQKIDPKIVEDAIAQFKKLTIFENRYRDRVDPGPMLQEMGLDLGTRKVGKHFDILGLLSSSTGDKNALLVRTGTGTAGETVTVEEALGSKKHILVCCVFLPLLHSRAYHIRGISSATLELKQLYGDDMFETVIVAHMIRGWKENKDAFDRFLTAFPGCYAVPFEDQKRREFICTVLNLRDLPLLATSVLVDTATHQVILDDDVTSYFGHWGANLYPFTQDKVKDLNLTLWKPQGFFSLEYLLGCTPSDSFSRLSGEEVQVSDLRNRHVGLYLYARGNSFDTVYAAHQRFKHKGFVVVVFPNPCDMEDPVLFEQFVRKSLLEVPDWVVMPYKDSTFRRLALRFPQKEDGLLIIDPHDKVLDPHCLDIIKEFGIDSFPFTRNHIIREKVRKFRNLKLDSLFSQKVLYRNNDPMDRYSPASLGLGIVFVFFSDEEGGGECLEALKVFLQMLKTEGPEFEVVVVLLANSISETNLSILSDVDSSWLICPLGEPPAAVADLAKEKIFFPRLGFLSFLDGELCSISRSGVAYLLEQLSPDERDDVVRLQVIESYVDYGLDYMGVKPFTLEYKDSISPLATQDQQLQ